MSVVARAVATVLAVVLPHNPDVDAAPVSRLEYDVLAVVAVGGIAGAEARYGLGVLWPHVAGAFPWTTLLINTVGCLLIGLLIGGLARLARPPRLARPLLGTGVLGGFTTFSAYAVDVVTLAHAGRWVVALAYLLLTIAVCLAAVAAGLAVTRR